MKKNYAKKIMLLGMCLGLTSMLSAQTVVKSYDWTKWSDATITNLKTDVANWEPVLSGEEVQRYRNINAVEGVISANGVAISELEGIEFFSVAATNFTIRFNHGTNCVQLGKTGPVTIKGLKKGQKVALKVRSASTTGSRGISEVTNLDGVVGESTYKLGDETGDIVYDLTVIADGDATFTNSGGLLLLGLTISEEAPAAPIKVAYVYKSDYSTDGSKWTIEKDKIYPALQAAGYEVTLKDVKDLDDAALAVADVPSLLAYDVVILQEAIGSGHQYVIAMKDIINKVPFLSMKSFAYKSSVWNWGAGVNPDKGAIKGQSKLTVAEAYRSHAIFEGVTIAADGSCQIFTADNADNNLIQGYSTNDVTAADPVFATVDNNGTPVNAIHTHDDGTGKNLYLLLPWSCDDSWQSLSDDGIKTVVNGVKFLAATKASDPATGIADTKVDAAKVVVSKAYYNLSGMRVKEPTQRGIYIIREVYEDGTSAARKVLVK